MTDVLPEALAAWGSADFITTLKREIETLDTLRLALTRRMNGFGTIDESITVMVLWADDQGEAIEARVTLHYTVTETKYCCPVGAMEQATHEVCGMAAQIDKRTAAATFLFHTENE